MNQALQGNLRGKMNPETLVSKSAGLKIGGHCPFLIASLNSFKRLIKYFLVLFKKVTHLALLYFARK